MTLAQGHVLEGKYVISRRIAEGGMSTVYLGVNSRIGKDVAVKVLHPGVACMPDVVERFQREARIVSRIRSAHVADVYDFGELPNGDHFMVMEYLEGESLAAIIEREHTVEPRLLALIASQILSALCAAHAAGVIHRDLKPENVIVTTRGAETLVKVVDFGISKCVDMAPGELRKTAADALMGTPLYMSPEQARGHTAEVDERTDLYALGVILYEATAGEPPFEGENVQDVLFRVALEDAKPLNVRVPSVDSALASIVHKAMAKRPADRFANAEDMLRAVEEWRARYSSSSLTPLAPSFAPLSASPSSSAPSGVSLDLESTARTVATPLAMSTEASPGAEAVVEEQAAVPAPRRRRSGKVVAVTAALACIVALGGAGIRHTLGREPAPARTTLTSAPPPPAAEDSASVNVAPAPVDLAVPAPPPPPTAPARLAASSPRGATPAARPATQVHKPTNPVAAEPAAKVVEAPPAPVVDATAAAQVPRAAAAPPASARRAYRATFE